MEEEQEDILALFGVPGVGAKTYARLVLRFGTPSGVFGASDKELLDMEGVGPKLVHAIRTYDRKTFVSGQKQLMEKCGAQLLTRISKDYPPLLNKFTSAPPVLFVRGDVSVLSEQSLAFVGTRRPSDYGIIMTRNLTGGAVNAGLCVVSGMAAGIDATAHRTALDHGGKTAAVFGCGVDILYPHENRKLAQDILQKGCLVSHFPMGIEPLRGNFPARNAVIVGLSLGTVVVEAPVKSGALITADLTMRAGRKLFAVPGNATSRTSEGSNGLLTKGAHPVTNIAHILPLIGKTAPNSPNGISSAPPVMQRPLPPGAGGEILKIIEKGPLHIDDICVRLGKPVPEVLYELTSLELEGYVKQNPGKIFERM
ncbi:DNA-processing protein DprA [bacterium]|nr:DNA-processing protein DprA [bacterium]